MKPRISALLFICLLSAYIIAQTPYDSFAPEATRPMIERAALYPEGGMQTEEPSTDTILCVAVVDLQRQTLLLIDIHDNTIIGTAPLSDDVLKWLSVDPLADKNIATSPYMYCNGNPIIFVDPDGMDWYKDEEGTAVLWQNSNDEKINIDGISYKNIGETYTHKIGNAEYNYNQNKLQSISYSTNTTFYSQGQDKTGCKRTCDKMVMSAGATPMMGRSGEILMTTHDENGVVTNATQNYKQGLYRLEDYLSNGTPCIIGVDYKSKQVHNLAPSGDGMTDHFVIIVGMTINVQNGSTSYNFYDPGSTAHGASPNNIISVIGDFLQGRTAAFGKPFTVTTIRKNKFLVW